MLTKEARAFLELGRLCREVISQFTIATITDSEVFRELDRYQRVEFASGKRNCRQGFPCKKTGGTGTCINKNKTCTNAPPGEPKTHREYVDKQLKALSAAGRLDEADAVLYTARRIARHPNEKTRSQLINSLRNRLESDEQLNAVLEQIDIESGIKSPRQLLNNISQFRVTGDEAKLKVGKRAELKPLELSDSQMMAIIPSTKAQHEALFIAKEYHAVAKEMDGLLDKTRSSQLSDDDYAAAFSKTGELAERLKIITDKAKTLVGKVDHPELDRYTQAIATMSKETLPGYQVALPSDLDKLREKAARQEC